jgi:deoxyribose-phosphate aldolase
MATLAVKVTANIEALKAALALGQTELIKTAAGAAALGRSLDGSKLEQNALQMAVAIKAAGGAVTLTAAEAKKADAIFTAWLEKAAK